MHAPTGDLASVMQADPTADGEEHELFTVSIDHHQAQVRDAQTAVDLAGQEVEAANQVLAAAQQTAVDRDGEVAASSGELAAAQAELADARAAASRSWSTWSLPIEGTSAFTAEELAEWYEEQGQGSSASVSIEDLTRAFVDQGDIEGVRGDMAFAQSVHETGWFSNRDTVFRNNFAGVGHCDSCPAGFSYTSAQQGALAQLQLLKSYAEVDPTYELPRADPDLDGPAGCCPNWADLGGVWATDGGYGPRILGRYAEMLEWLVAERTAPSP
jgi:hypothetical protein